jgi:hypothetical protein
MVYSKALMKVQNTIIDREAILNLERSIPSFYNGSEAASKAPLATHLHVD